MRSKSYLLSGKVWTIFSVRTSSCVSGWANTKASMTCQNCNTFFPRFFFGNFFGASDIFGSKPCWQYLCCSRSFDLHLRFPSFLMFSDSFLPNLFKLKRLWMIESKCVQTIFGSASHVRLFVFIHNFFSFPLCQPFFVHTVFLFFVHLTTTCRRLIYVEKRSVDFTTCIK